MSATLSQMNLPRPKLGAVKRSYTVLEARCEGANRTLASRP